MDIVGLALKGVLLPIVVLLIGMWLIKRVRADLVSSRSPRSDPSGGGAMEAMMAEARAQRERLNREE